MVLGQVEQAPDQVNRLNRVVWAEWYSKFFNAICLRKNAREEQLKAFRCRCPVKDPSEGSSNLGFLIEFVAIRMYHRIQ